MTLELTDKNSLDNGVYYRLFSKARGPVCIWEPDLIDYTTAGTVVFVHGFRLNQKTHTWYVDQVWEEFKLIDKFQTSTRNARFVAIQNRASRASKTRWLHLRDLLAALNDSLSSISGPVVVIGHSAAYLTVANWIGNVNLMHLTLLDGLYGKLAAYQRHMNRRGVTSDMVVGKYSSNGPYKNSRNLMSRVKKYLTLEELPDTYDLLSDDAKNAKNLYVTVRLPHMEFVQDPRVIPLFIQRGPLSEVEIQGC